MKFGRLEEAVISIQTWINEHERPSEVPRMTKSELDAKREVKEKK